MDAITSGDSTVWSSHLAPRLVHQRRRGPAHHDSTGAVIELVNWRDNNPVVWRRQ
jgi:hypothetical protein